MAITQSPLGVTEQEDSVFGQVSSTVAPVFEPLGFGTWQATGSLITGFIAKELVVSTLSQIYVGAQEDLLSKRRIRLWTT